MSAQSLKYRCFIVAFTILGAACLGLANEQDKPRKEPAPPEGYRIGAGDVLQILVWKEPDDSVADAMVRVDGKISVPLVGDIDVAGLTIEQLQTSLVAKLSHFINNPVVTVYARQINSRKVYVLGMVKKEGPIPLLRPMTVLQALVEAGGLGEWANKKKIYILRTVNGTQTKLMFNYGAVIKGEHLDQNIALLPDDTIIVP
jgi:polysaccharide export outer membrane protein